VGAPETGDAVKLEDAHGNGEGWQMRSTGNQSLTHEGSRHTEVTLAQSNILLTRGLIELRDCDQQHREKRAMEFSLQKVSNTSTG